MQAVDILKLVSSVTKRFQKKYWLTNLNKEDLSDDLIIYIYENKYENLEERYLMEKCFNKLKESFFPKRTFISKIFKKDIENYYSVGNIDVIKTIYRLSDSQISMLMSEEIKFVETKYRKRVYKYQDIENLEDLPDIPEEVEYIHALKEMFYEHQQDFNLTLLEEKLIDLIFSGYDINNPLDFRIFKESLGVQSPHTLRTNFLKLEYKLSRNSPFRKKPR